MKKAGQKVLNLKKIDAMDHFLNAMDCRWRPPRARRWRRESSRRCEVAAAAERPRCAALLRQVVTARRGGALVPEIAAAVEGRGRGHGPCSCGGWSATVGGNAERGDS